MDAAERRDHERDKSGRTSTLGDATGFWVVIALALFAGGMWSFGEAFRNEAFQTVWFLGGILMIALALFVPAHFASRN
ncbi:hypothetical protein ITJ57_18085 [Plantibacter sp. VKM Ac-2880]|jgi:hypothetical protein|uniref:hypothetical protein n=1 Tax=unclassified Plantibacter TaxID=2624265 RepID=UPI0006FD7EC3|nr:MULTISPECIES: hypothetical protein [unclassified Plantibacter]KQM13545.1 hypothetical protein ASE44_17625 [Plantibacter sp. Leaf1]KQR56654.1 hypothetical protein ASF83_17610 [Plantibacter sp. Leaf171]MBF4570680.1 hypothetical protein [Plantibacter sp. VKM Ac-2880]